jgi:hypothetical protein
MVFLRVKQADILNQWRKGPRLPAVPGAGMTASKVFSALAGNPNLNAMTRSFFQFGFKFIPGLISDAPPKFNAVALKPEQPIFGCILQIIKKAARIVNIAVIIPS